MAACFDGCGREISGIRARANNEVAAQMSQHLAVMQGALDRGEAGGREAQTRAMVDEGVALIDGMRRYLHGELDRDDLDQKAIKEWSRNGAKLAGALAASTSGPPWMPDDRANAHLAQSGQRAKGVITDVRKDGIGNERVADLAIAVTVRTPDGSTMDLTRSLSISVVKAPRVGDQIEVAYDPADPDRFVYRPLVELPPA